jgi:hypothetical protein
MRLAIRYANTNLRGVSLTLEQVNHGLFWLPASQAWAPLATAAVMPLDPGNGLSRLDLDIPLLGYRVGTYQAAVYGVDGYLVDHAEFAIAPPAAGQAPPDYLALCF